MTSAETVSQQILARIEDIGEATPFAERVRDSEKKLVSRVIHGEVDVLDA
jgi:hypothetical protein